MPIIIPRITNPPQVPPLSVHNYGGTNKKIEKLGAKNQKYLKNPGYNRYGANSSLNQRAQQ